MTRRNQGGARAMRPDDKRELEPLTIGAQMAQRQMGGRYTVQDKIGTGGMAIVYRGLDEVLGRTVAIKTMLPQYANDPSFAARFKQEAQAAAALQSPYIVSVYDWGKDGDTYYIIMEYLRGTDLKSGIRKHGALDCRKVAQIGSQISQALSVAHHHDIIHRDIKPQNIMVQPDGNIKVMDFGIARAKNSHLTTDNSVLGTAHYVSPEQTQGQELGPTTDIYSLGIVMYEAATGQVPFDGDDAISVALKQVNEPPMPPSQINPRVDPALEAIILKCMQKRPEDRFQTSEELYRVLRDYLAGRLQAVNQSAAVTSTPANRTQRTTPLNRARQGTGRIAGNTTGHYRIRSAREAELDRKHRRHVAVGIIVTILAIASIAMAGLLIANRQRTTVVPDVVGLTQEEAINRIVSSGFTQGEVKPGFSNDYPEGTIFDQNPDAGNAARKGSKIDLVVSKGPEPAQAVTVPDLTNMTPTEAGNALGLVALKAQEGDTVFSDHIEAGRVAAQNPAPNATIKAGDTVTYNLSKGGDQVDVPNVVGMSREEATTTLEQAGFAVQIATEENDEYAAGIVCAQSATEKASRGSTITITVSAGASTTEIPYVVGRSESSAYSTLTGAGFNVITVSVASSDPAGTVVSQSDYGRATPGSTIQIEVSVGMASSTDTSYDTGTGTGTSSGTSTTSDSDSDSSGSSSTSDTSESDTSSSGSSSSSSGETSSESSSGSGSGSGSSSSSSSDSSTSSNG